MKAILKEIKVPQYHKNNRRHPIKMFFSESEDNNELYCFGTTIEAQFGTTDEYDVKEEGDEEMFDEKVKYANTLVGKTFEINLYKFTVKELTNNKFVALERKSYLYYSSDFETIEGFYIASYMTKEDVILNLKYSITKLGIDGIVEGVLPDESTEEITTELFFPKPIPEKKHFNIPYGKYPNLNSNYVIKDVPIKDICKGRNLAYQIKDRDFSKYDFDRYVHVIEDYRSKVRAAKMEKESLRKKLFFWEPKVVVEELKLSSNVISLMKDCIILGKEYPSDCDKADIDYAEECEKRLRKEFMGEDTEKKDFKNKLREFRQSLRKKYKGRDVISPVN